MKYDIVSLYVCIDNFSKIYEEWEQKKLIRTTKNRKREGKLSMSKKLLRKRFFSPVVSISIGNTSLFHFRGLKRSDKTKSIKLNNRDILIM